MGHRHIVGPTIAVVPTYRPEHTLVERLDHLIQQCDRVLVVDDGSPASSRAVLDEVVAAGAELILSPENRGIASALNLGIREALAGGAAYVLTVDQDTIVPADYVERARMTIENSSVTLGIACPASVNGALGRPGSVTPEGIGILRVAIQSGLLITAECLDDCGLFDERLFIDLVDTEYCLRIARRGYAIGAVPDTDIIHSLGELVPLRPWGRLSLRDGVPETYEYHQPRRRYFISRNLIDLYLRYIFVDPRWVVSSVRGELGAFWTTVTSGPHRRKHALAALVGITHGLIRRRGPVGSTVKRWLSTG